MPLFYVDRVRWSRSQQETAWAKEECPWLSPGTKSCNLHMLLCLTTHSLDSAKILQVNVLKSLVREKTSRLCSWLFKKSKQHRLANKSPCSKNSAGQKTPAPQFLQQPCIWNRSHCAREGLEKECWENISGSPAHRHWQDTWRDVATEADTDRGTASQSAGAQGPSRASELPACCSYYLFAAEMKALVTDFSFPLVLVKWAVRMLLE